MAEGWADGDAEERNGTEWNGSGRGRRCGGGVESTWAWGGDFFNIGVCGLPLVRWSGMERSGEERSHDLPRGDVIGRVGGHVSADKCGEMSRLFRRFTITGSKRGVLGSVVVSKGGKGQRYG